MLGRHGLMQARRWPLDHPVLFVLLVALVVRLVAALLFTITVGMEKFPDTDGYDRLAAERASGAYHDWDAESAFFWDRYAGYVYPLHWLYRIFGSHLFSGQLLAAAFGALAAAVICRLLLEVSDRRWALLGGLIVALFPSQILWSSVAYKDSAVWLASAAMALLAARASRAVGWRLLGYGAALAGLLFWLGHLRRPTLIVCAWALLIAACFSTGRRDRVVRVAGAGAILIAVPVYLGVGPGGLDYASSYTPSEIREENAEGADTSFVESGDESGLGDLTHLPRGLSIILLEPYPWTSFGGYEVRLAQVELLVWYPLLALSVFGVPTVVRKRRELAFVAVTAAGMLGVYALYEGNFGTAYRHRSELVLALAVFAALGASRLFGAPDPRGSRSATRGSAIVRAAEPGR